MSKKSASQLFPTEEAKFMGNEDMSLPESPADAEAEGVSGEDESAEDKQEDKPITRPDISDDIVDVDFKEIKKSRFRFNGDNSKILELNTRDLGISYRLEESYNKLNSLMEKVADRLDGISDNGSMSDEDRSKVINGLKDLDSAMRSEIDYLFDAPVSDILGADGSMYDPIAGVFRYERIIEKLTSFYETDLNHEFAVLKRRVEGRTSKYTRVKNGISKYHN